MRQKKSIALSLCLLTYGSHVQSDTASSVMTFKASSTKTNLSKSTLGASFSMKAPIDTSVTQSPNSPGSFDATIQLKPSIEAAKNIEMSYIQYDINDRFRSFHMQHPEKMSNEQRTRAAYNAYFAAYQNNMKYLIVDTASTLENLILDHQKKTIKTALESQKAYTGVIVYIKDAKGIVNGIATIKFDDRTGRLVVQYSLRGTRDLNDWYKNLNTIHATFPEDLDKGALFQNKDNVHKGFLERFNEIYNGSIQYIHAFVGRMRQTFQCPIEIRCTGHSLGGAQATLLWMNMISFYGGYKYEPDITQATKTPVPLVPITTPIYITLETYGSPRVLSRKQSEIINKAKDNIFRFVNNVPKKSITKLNNDIVPNVPIEKLDFYHVGEEIKLAVKDDPSDLLPLYEAGIIPHGISGSVAALARQPIQRNILDADVIVNMIKNGQQ